MLVFATFCDISLFCSQFVEFRVLSFFVEKKGGYIFPPMNAFILRDAPPLPQEATPHADRRWQAALQSDPLHP